MVLSNYAPRNCSNGIALKQNLPPKPTKKIPSHRKEHQQWILPSSPPSQTDQSPKLSGIR